MPSTLLTFVTDFADQAVVLPLIACVALVLWASGWHRGAIVWCVGTGATLAVMLALKLGMQACGPALFGPTMDSPSGHTAAAGAVYGSIFAFINGRLGGPSSRRSVIVLAVVTLIGTSRVMLGAHSWPEACLGGIVGVVAAEAILRIAGEPTSRQPVLLSALPLLLVPLLLHGVHLGAEGAIREMPLDFWPFTLCR